MSRFTKEEVKSWLKYNKEKLKELKRDYKLNPKDYKTRREITHIETYIQNMNAYLRTDLWLDLFYGKDQEHKIIYSVCTPRLDEDGCIERNNGYYYNDLGLVWDDSLLEEN